MSYLARSTMEKVAEKGKAYSATRKASNRRAYPEGGGNFNKSVPAIKQNEAATKILKAKSRGKTDANALKDFEVWSIARRKRAQEAKKATNAADTLSKLHGKGVSTARGNAYAKSKVGLREAVKNNDWQAARKHRDAAVKNRAFKALMDDKHFESSK